MVKREGFCFTGKIRFTGVGATADVLLELAYIVHYLLNFVIVSSWKGLIRHLQVRQMAGLSDEAFLGVPVFQVLANFSSTAEFH